MDNQNKKKRFDDTREWSSAAIELGIIGGIGAGVGATILRGNASSAAQGSGRAVKQIANKVDNYLERSVFRKNPMGRFIYKTLKRVPAQSAKLHRENEAIEAGLNYDLAKIDANIKANILEERKRLAFHEVIDANLNNRTARPVDEIFDEQAHVVRLKADAGDRWRSGEDVDYTIRSGNPQSGEQKRKGRSWNDSKKGSLGSEAVGSAVAGLGFGAGLTAFHALDKRLLGEDKKKERSYGAAGSLLSKQAAFPGLAQLSKLKEVVPEGAGTLAKDVSSKGAEQALTRDREDDTISKAAGASDVYRNIEGFGGRIPNAVANGIGYTAVTLGTASLLEKVRAEARKKVGGEDNTASPQVVIVNEGKVSKKQKNQTLETIHALSNASAQHDMMTRQAGFPHVVDAVKSKVQQLPQGAQDFLKDLGGHGTERKLLKERIAENGFSYQNEAIRHASKEQIDDLAQVYGKAFNEEKSREMALGEVARNLKATDQQKHDQLYEQMAKARLKTIGGAGAVGGIAALARPKKEEQR